MNKKHVRIALRDIARGLQGYSLAGFLAWEDIRQRYVRTMLGPLWIVLSTGVWFSAMAFVMANLFNQDMHEYLPFLVSGLLVWMLISSSIIESSQILVMAAPLITAFPIPIFTHYLRFMIRNGIIFLHNVIILAIVLFIYPPELTSASWLAIPALLLDMVLLTALAVVLSLVNLRYRDANLAIASAMQVLPFVTPVFWDRGLLKSNLWIADVNPFYHMIEIVRAPALGKYPSDLSWIMTGSITLVLIVVACLMFVRYRHRIIFWL